MQKASKHVLVAAAEMNCLSKHGTQHMLWFIHCTMQCIRAMKDSVLCRRYARWAYMLT